MAKTNLDFSSRTAPAEWYEAQGDAPEADTSPLQSRSRMAVLPDGGNPDILIGFLTGMAVTLVFCVAWFVLSVEGEVRGSWPAILLGAFIAMAVRLGAGPSGADQRATMALMFYLCSIFALHYWIERAELISFFTAEPTHADIEDALVRNHLNQPWVMLSWGLGLYAAVHGSYLLRRRWR